MIKKKYFKNKNTCKVTFCLPLEAAQSAQEVRVVGDFNDWSWENGLKMKATKTEYQAIADLEVGQRYEFRYWIDNEQWENDWDADDYVSSPYGDIKNSVVSLETEPN